MPTITMLPKGLEHMANKQFASLSNHMGLPLHPDQAAFLQGTPSPVGGIQKAASANFAAVPTTPVATGLPALGDGPASPQESPLQHDVVGVDNPETPPKAASPPEEPALKKQRTLPQCPHVLLELAKNYYAHGPADPKPALPELCDAAAEPPLVYTAEPTASPKGPAVVKAPVPKPTKLPERPTRPDFKAFQWGGFTICHGGPRSTYRVSTAPGARTTRFLKNWAEVCEHIVKA